MAQFSHPEFGGSGQWMRSGMIMVSDMFNNLLKGRIDALCREFSGLVANQPDLIAGGSSQSQSQGSQQQGGSGPAGPVNPFVPPGSRFCRPMLKSGCCSWRQSSPGIPSANATQTLSALLSRAGNIPMTISWPSS
jgi:hypothetical protein